ncbi:SprT-like family-domain-containing protein [Mycena epipterygia]|nr:SprT-like family-domain-containing protein [Mycena epipterygia]
MSDRLNPSGLGPARRDARSTGTGTPKKIFPIKPSKWDGIEVVPDSEEERTRGDSDVIEISSDEDEEIPNPKRNLGDPALRVPGAWPESPLTKTPQVKPPQPRPLQTPATPTPSKKRNTSSNHRPSQSTDRAEDQVVVLADPEWLTPKAKVSPKHFYGSKSKTPRTLSPEKSVRDEVVPETTDGSDSEVEVLSGPVRVLPPKEKLQPLYDDDSDTSPGESSEAPSTDRSSSQPVFDAPNKYAKYWTPPATPASKAKVNTPVKASTPSTASGSKSLQKPKKLSQRALERLEAQERAAHRVEYAGQVYSYLNRVVFKDRLPPLTDVEIKWNNQMTSTAGRAQFHRDRHGNEFAEIQLAPKVVDSDERIRNTLAHEMCHLACWMIDKEIKEAHGKIFHKWAEEVERKDPVITISVRHTYEIYYPYEWRCGDCDKLIQRYKNSVDTSKGCPKCKTGTLVPLFDLPEKKGLELSTTSKMAIAKPQNSPRPPPPRSTSLISISSDSDEDEDMPSIHVQKEIFTVPDSDDEEAKGEDKAITDLARTFGGITITNKVCLHAKRAARGPRT